MPTTLIENRLNALGLGRQSVQNILASLDGNGIDPGDIESVEVQEKDIEIGNEAYDGQVSLRISTAGRSVYILITDRNEIRFFDDRHIFSGYGIFSPNISRWAAKIDPTRAVREVSRHSPEKKLAAFRRDEAVAGYRQAGLDHDRIAQFDALDGLLTLPEDHPARVFIQQTLAEFGHDVETSIVPILKRLVDKSGGGDFYTIKGLVELGHRDPKYFRELITLIGEAGLSVPKEGLEIGNEELLAAYEAVANKYIYILRDMKTAGTFYEIGADIYHQYPSLQDKDMVRILYPAAGGNIGAVSMAMGLIDQGSKDVEMILTDINPEKVEEFRQVLQEWIDANPDMEGRLGVKHIRVDEDIDGDGIEDGPREKGGQRRYYEFTYKGRKIRIIYALNDSSEGLYFHPSDLQRSDIAVSHDPMSGGFREPDVLLLDQFLSVGKREKTIYILENEFDATAAIYSKEQTPDFPNIGAYKPSLIAARGKTVGDGYGCAETHGVTIVSGITEAGTYLQRSAIIIDSEAPLLKLLTTDGDREVFTALCIGAGGTIAPPAKQSIGGFIKLAQVDEPIVKTSNTLKTNLVFQWVADTLLNLPKEDADYLRLVTLRYVAMKVNDLLLKDGAEKYAKRSDKDIAAAFKKVLLEIPDGLKTELIETAKKYRIKFENLADIASKDFKRLDALILRQQAK